MEPHSDIFRTWCNTCMYNCVILRILAYLEPEASSKACWTCKMIMHILSQWHSQKSLFKNFQGYSEIFRECIFNHTNTRATRGRGEAATALFENRKKCPDFGKKGPDCVQFWVKFSIQNVVLRLSTGKISKMFFCMASYSCVFNEMFIVVLFFHKPPPPALKDFCLSTAFRHYILFASASS